MSMELLKSLVATETRLRKQIETTEALRTENAKLRAELAELKDYYARVISEPCPDEQHCTCVPALRAELDALRATLSHVVFGFDHEMAGKGREELQAAIIEARAALGVKP